MEFDDWLRLIIFKGLSWWLSGKEYAWQCRNHRKHGFNPRVRKIPWRRAWQPTPVFLPGEFHGQRSLVGNSSWDRKELDTTEQLTLNIIYTESLCINGLLRTILKCKHYLYYLPTSK